jgi:hypothetical protein
VLISFRISCRSVFRRCLRAIGLVKGGEVSEHA